jgi:carbonic anhydrase
MIRTQPTAVAVAPADSARHFADAVPLLAEHGAWLESVLGYPVGHRQPGWWREIRRPDGVYTPPSGRLLVARAGGIPRGVVGVSLTGRAAELKRMYVQPAARGLGLGRALLLAAIDAARELGATRLWLETSPVLMGRAVHLYRDAGFVPGPPREFADQPQAMTMELALGE